MIDKNDSSIDNEDVQSEIERLVDEKAEREKALALSNGNEKEQNRTLLINWIDENEAYMTWLQSFNEEASKIDDCGVFYHEDNAQERAEEHLRDDCSYDERLVIDWTQSASDYYENCDKFTLENITYYYI